MTMPQPPRHKVFMSFHHEDQKYKSRFVRMMKDNIVDESVSDGDIDPNIATDTTRAKIRDKYIREATVTVVLIGPCTWRRKHVDWEIRSSLRETRSNPRCGLLGILLPHHPDHGKNNYSPHLIPPRLADNAGGDDSYAVIYDWSKDVSEVRTWIHAAFKRRKGTPPDNSRRQFRRNWKGACAEGWQN